MSDLSARLDLPLIKPSQAQKHVTHNEALQILDGLVQAVLEETGAETPPLEPVQGQMFALGPAPTGDWAGQAGMLALRIEQAWLFLDPQEGWRAWDTATGALVVHETGAWVPVQVDLQNLDGVGINTTSDATNRLAVASDASLFSHDGAGHQIKVNKAGSGDTASLLFQSGWTGHAEMGLAGDTAFSIKVSANGSTWRDAIKADAAAQEVEIDFQLTGDAVQQNATDTTAGRLMRADYGFGPGNLLGTVSQSGGTPTGAAIERGSNANGEYVRYADGTQICWMMDQGVDVTSTGTQTFTYPAAFLGDPVISLSHRDTAPNAALCFSNIRSIRDVANTSAGLRLLVAGTSSDPADDSERLDFCAFGRWF